MDETTEPTASPSTAGSSGDVASASEPVSTIPSDDDTTDPAPPGLWDSGDPPSTLSIPQGDPTAIGRYRVIRRLGQGGFGRVYLASDDELDRSVAVKVPNPERVAGPEDVEAYVAEARTLAKLDHPHIVPVYDVGRTDDGLCYVVSKYVEGINLAERMRQGRLAFRESAELVATVALALHHSHTRGLVHRDVKPANILLDAQGRACVADYGLALREEDYGKRVRLGGTPAYMSPEQARGEGHRVDGRSDVFSLGVVLYELLTGRRPFRGDSLTAVMDEIARAEERPPRQVDDTIPRELERVCQKMLAKRASERYNTARDLADDLQHFLQSDASAGTPKANSHPSAAAPVSTGEATSNRASGQTDTYSRPAVRIVPKGLRSFDKNDADYFLELLPGPRDRDGLPDSLRFWKTRIETTDPDTAFKVGLIYGPSGCGKSSLVKAGLLPRLAKHVLPVYIEATPDETEARLLKALRRACPDLAPELGLVDSLSALRRGRGLRGGQKVLLVVDQFEQWLFARRTEIDTELVAALRQCDGERVQAVVMVRDDFWMAASRFMRELEVRLLEGENSAAADLFDPLHARKVLAAFGRAYGVLPERTRELSPEQNAFLDQSVKGLTQDGKVISVRLALFAEMVKGKPWTPATLGAVGGTQGVGVTFLEETFSAATAPPEHRVHQKAAQAILRALLPQTGTDIKGQMRSVEKLRDASGYADRPRDFDDLIRILDPELRLITPTDPEGAAGEGPPAGDGRRYYQLTHDYLVRPLRDWLTRKQRETRRGRAGLRLAERTALWTAKPENRRLPSTLEWVNIRLLTRPKDWTEPERTMMKAAQRRQIGNAVVSASIFIITTIGFFYIRSQINSKLIRSQVQEQVRQLWSIDLRYLPQHLDRLDKNRALWKGQVGEYLGRPAISTDLRTRGSLALARHDSSRLDYLTGRLLDGEPPEQRVVRGELARWQDQIVPGLWRELGDPGAAGKRRLAAAAALAAYEPGSPRWDPLAKPTVRELIAQDPLQVSAWVEALRPVRDRLRPHLLECFDDPSAGEVQKSLVAGILVDYASADGHYLPGEVMAELLLKANRAQLAIILPLASGRRVELADRLAGSLREPVPLAPGAERERQVERQGNAAEVLLLLGRGEQFWPLLRQSPDPQLRTQLIDRIGAVNLSWETLLERFGKETDGSIRQAILLGLEGCESTRAQPLRNRIAERLLSVYESDPDGGVHGAAEWLLTRWGFADQVGKAKGRLAGRPPGGKRWFITRYLHTMLVIPRPGKITIGSPPHEVGRDASERLRETTIDYAFAISAHEVTLKEFRHYRSSTKVPKNADCPMNFVTWYDAAKYCRWLSEQPVEAIPEEERCYPALEQIGPAMQLPADYLRREGYRLPTEKEWEYAARAGSTTPWFFGSSVANLDKYAWSGRNSEEDTWPVGQKRPNPLGLFDVYGNVTEWCDTRDSGHDSKEYGVRGGDYRSTPRFLRSAMSPWLSAESKLSVVGFRIVRTLAPSEVEPTD